MPKNSLIKITDHVYWMQPDVPDRPSLCAVVGQHSTLVLDAGASEAHTRLFLDALKAEGIAAPRYVVLSHWHWDHVFGAATLGVPIIAHAETAKHLAVLAGYDWSDVALDERVETGEEIAFCADNIKLELPEPRSIQIALPDIVFDKTLAIFPGAVTCHIQHVGGDHAADSCVIHILPDKVLFLGDCLYDAIYAPVRYLTTQRLFPLLDTILRFDAEFFIEGHNDTVMTRAEIEAMINKMRLAGTLVDQIGTDEAAVLSAIATQTGQTADEDLTDLVQAFIAGHEMK